MIESSIFARMDDFTFHTDSLGMVPYVYGSSEKELVFDTQGRYQIAMGDDLNTDSGGLVYSCVLVLQ